MSERAAQPRLVWPGRLCPPCICARAHYAGLERVEAKFTSGPFGISYRYELHEVEQP